MYPMLIARLLVPGSPFAQMIGASAARIVAGMLFLFCAIGYAGIFAKAGKPRAKAFVPVLDVFTAYRISGAGPLLFTAYAVTVALGASWPALAGMVGADTGQAGSFVDALALFFYAYQCFRLSAAFGKDIPSAAALLLAEPLYALLLGYGPAVYDGSAKPVNPFQPFNVDRYLSDESPLDADLKLKDEYKEGYDRS